jgi:L-amino acid N-acyltransferase YncA
MALMPDPTIRDFRPGDIAAVTAIYSHYVRESVSTFELEPPSEAEMAARFADMTAKGHPILIAERAGEIIGYAYASTFRAREAYRFTCENSIYFVPEAVGHGYGGPMLERLIEAARAAGLKQMVAAITGEREASIRLHARHGFRHVGRYEQVGYKFDRWLDVVLMQRAL